MEQAKQREKCLNTGKYGPEKTPYLDIFRAVQKWLSKKLKLTH